MILNTDILDRRRTDFVLADPEPSGQSLIDSLRRAVLDQNGFITSVDMRCFGITQTFIFVRKAYLEIADRIIYQRLIGKEDGYRDTLAILGPQGCGKTHFLVFMMYLLLKAGVHTFLFAPLNCTYLLSKGNLYSIHGSIRPSSHLFGHKIWCIYDSSQEPSRSYDPIVIQETDLDSEHFSKKSILLFLTLWSPEEAFYLSRLQSKYQFDDLASIMENVVLK